jgi:hypothetical protein
MKRWLVRTVFALLAAFVLLYFGDWFLFRMRGTPTSAVTVHRLLTVPLKGGRQEFDDQGTLVVPCSRSLFPQTGLMPCWQLRRHPEQNTAL